MKRCLLYVLFFYSSFVVRRAICLSFLFVLTFHSCIGFFLLYSTAPSIGAVFCTSFLHPRVIFSWSCLRLTFLPDIYVLYNSLQTIRHQGVGTSIPWNDRGKHETYRHGNTSNCAGNIVTSVWVSAKFFLANKLILIINLIFISHKLCQYSSTL